MYDVIIIGAGPAGIFTALELIKLKSAKKVLLVEQGRRIENRVCPIEKTGKCLKCKPCCNITSGFSGAGAFSDGKLLSYHLSLYNEREDNFYLGGNDGAFIKQYLKTSEIKSLLKYTDDIYLEFGADSHLEGVERRDEILELQKKAKKEDLNLIDIPLRHLGTEKAHILYKKIEDFISDKVDMLFNTTVKDIIVKGNKVVGVKTEDLLTHEEKEFKGDKVIIAVGRKGASWLEKLCKEHNIKTRIGSVDIGVRYELPNKVMQKINELLYEGKVIAYPEPFKDKVRTFCQNPGGFVTTEVYDDGVTLVNGHSYKDRKSENTNLAILVSHHFNYPFDKPIEYGENIAKNSNSIALGNIIVQRLGDIRRGKRTWKEELESNTVKPTLKTAVAGDITYALGYRTMTDILEFIRKMDKVVEGFANPDNLLYAPEIKFYSNELVVNKNFETSIKNLYSIGDGGGLTTGLMMASASGVKMARILEKK